GASGGSSKSPVIRGASELHVGHGRDRAASPSHWGPAAGVAQRHSGEGRLASGGLRKVPRRGESAGIVGGGAPRAPEHARQRGAGSASLGAQGASPGVGFAGARLGAGLAPETVRAEETSGCCARGRARRVAARACLPGASPGRERAPGTGGAQRSRRGGARGWPGRREAGPGPVRPGEAAAGVRAGDARGAPGTVRRAGLRGRPRERAQGRLRVSEVDRGHSGLAAERAALLPGDPDQVRAAVFFPQRPAAGRRHGGDPSNESFRGDGSSFRSEDSLGRSLLRRPTPDVEAELVLQAVDALSRRIAALEADKEKVEAECERSQRVIAGLEDELAATKSTLARLTKANNTLVAGNGRRDARLSSQLEVVSELKHASQTLEWEKASLVDQLADAARRYQLKTDQCDKLQSRLSKLELERQLSQAKVERLKLRVTESQAEVRVSPGKVAF
ncbi:hypothetical protein HPB47_016828, partial [Ixodes persulcatus]